MKCKDDPVCNTAWLATGGAALLFVIAPELFALGDAALLSAALRLLGPRGVLIVAEIAGVTAVGGKELKAPFNPNPPPARNNCVQCVVAFLKSVTSGRLVTADPNVVSNGGSIAVARNMITAAARVRFGEPQQSTLNTPRTLQFFVVFDGANKDFSDHVLMGINLAGKDFLYDPQSGEKFSDIAKYGTFIAFPVLLPQH